MESKSIKIVIVFAIIIGIIAVIAIPTIVVLTTKNSEPQSIDLNDEELNNGVEEVNEETQSEGTISEELTNFEEENEEQTTSSAENPEKSALESFKEKLKEFEGDRVSGKKLNELIDIIRRNNEQNQEHSIKAMADVQNWDSDSNKANEDSMYNIVLEEDEQTGYITTVKIKDAD